MVTLHASYPVTGMKVMDDIMRTRAESYVRQFRQWLELPQGFTYGMVRMPPDQIMLVKEGGRSDPEYCNDLLVHLEKAHGHATTKLNVKVGKTAFRSGSDGADYRGLI